MTAILINILNRKLSIFFLVFLPQSVAVDEPYPLARMLELSTAFMAMTFAVFALYGLFGATCATASSRAQRRWPGCAGILPWDLPRSAPS